MNILDLLRGDGIMPRKAAGTHGGEYHSPCPGCGGRDRFHSWPEQNGGEGSWWCRVCDTGGDALQYLMDFRRMDFRAAAQFMGRKLDPRRPRPLLPLAHGGKVPREWTPEPAREPSERWRAKAGELVAEAHACLLRTPEQLDYLAGRGLPLEAVRRYRLGWLARDAYKQRTAWGLPREVSQKTGKPSPLWIPMGLVIPVYRNGELHRVRVRRPKPGPFGPKKYCWVPGSGGGPMVLTPQARAFVVVEAELDAMLCDFATGDDVGALGLGTISAKPDAWTHELLVKSLGILNALDCECIAPASNSDAARKEAERKTRQQRRVRDWWQRTYDHAERWPVPAAKDPGEAFAAGEDIAAWITAGLPPAMLIPKPKAQSGAQSQAQASAATADSPQAAAPAPASRPAASASVSAPAKLAAPDGLHANLPALERLLRETGIRLTFQSSRPFDIPEPVQGHTGVLRRLKELCFFDDALGAYLDRHPAAIITVDNLIVK